MTYTDCGNPSVPRSNMYAPTKFLRRVLSLMTDRAFYCVSREDLFGLTSTSSLSTFRRQLKTLLCTTSYPDGFHRT